MNDSLTGLTTITQLIHTYTHTFHRSLVS